MKGALTAVLTVGCHGKNWHQPDPAATALRLSALHDGLVALILSGLGAFRLPKRNDISATRFFSNAREVLSRADQWLGCYGTNEDSWPEVMPCASAVH